MYEFACTGPIAANLQVASGVLNVFAEDRDNVQVTVAPVRDNDNGRAAADGTRVEMNGNSLIVETPTYHGFNAIRRGGNLVVEVRMPAGSTLEARVASADMVLKGRYATASLNTASGDVRLENVGGDLTFQSASGDGEIGHVGGDATIQTASGDVRAASVGGTAAVRTASGDITIDAVGASAKIHTASGDVRIGSTVRGETRINTASGDVRVGVAEGTVVWLDLGSASGDSRSELPVSDSAPSGTAPTLTLHARTASGDITVKRAPRATDRRATGTGDVFEYGAAATLQDSVQD